MSKPRYTAAQVQKYLKVNESLKRLPFYLGQGMGAGHLLGTKHSKAWGDFGYPLSLDFWFFHAAYSRIGLANAVVNRHVDACWLTNPTISIGENDHDRNPQETEIDEFIDRVNLFNQFKDVDEMQRVGHYAGLIMRVADDKPLSAPLDPGFKLDNIQQVMPAWEGQLLVGNIDNNPKSLRYGLPETYTYQQRGVHQHAQRDGTESFTVHHSRVLIWNEGARGNTIYGTSALEPVYNALIDWEKIRGAGGEGFWRQAALRGVLEAVNSEVQAPGEDELDDLMEAIHDMQSSFDAVPFLGGSKLNTLQTTLSDPKGFGEIALQDVAAGCGWSAKGLVGTQEGRFAGDQDTSGDMRTAQARREHYLSSQIKGMLKWLVANRCIKQNPYEVSWDDLAAPSDSAKLENAGKMSKINQEMAQTGQGAVYTPQEIRLATGYDAEPEGGFPEAQWSEGETEQ